LAKTEQNELLTIFNLKYNIDKKYYDCRFIKFAENLLTGHIIRQILISSVVKEDKISLTEVLRILEESKEIHHQVDGHF
jgi:pantothenate kinase type III